MRHMTTVRPGAGDSRTLTAERGCLVVADISGYTDYVVESPLEHAEDVLAEVTHLVAEQLGAAFRINKQEGDAVFGYALDGAADASMVLDSVEGAYFAFRRRLEGIGHSTSCGCGACAKLPDLDLKVVLHEGEFIRRPSAAGEELTGRDVIVVHRLLKNEVAAAFGTRGYLLCTEDCVEALGLDAGELGFREHVERYEDVGETTVFVLDLEARFREESDRRRIIVEADAADFEVDVRFPGVPSAVWEHLTAPAKRIRWRGGTIEEETVGGRRAPGTTAHCVDGRALVYEEILDWRPFEYFTERRSLKGDARLVLTTALEPDGSDTRVVTRGTVENGGLRTRGAVKKTRRELADGYAWLATLMEKDANGGSCRC